MLEHIQPEGLFPSERLGFTQVVTSAPGRLVFVSGRRRAIGRVARSVAMTSRSRRALRSRTSAVRSRPLERDRVT